MASDAAVDTQMLLTPLVVRMHLLLFWQHCCSILCFGLGSVGYTKVNSKATKTAISAQGARVASARTTECNSLTISLSRHMDLQQQQLASTMECNPQGAFRGRQQLEGDKVQHCCGDLVGARKGAHRHGMILQW